MMCCAHGGDSIENGKMEEGTDRGRNLENWMIFVPKRWLSAPSGNVLTAFPVQMVPR